MGSSEQVRSRLLRPIPGRSITRTELIEFAHASIAYFDFCGVGGGVMWYAGFSCNERVSRISTRIGGASRVANAASELKYKVPWKVEKAE